MRRFTAYPCQRGFALLLVIVILVLITTVMVTAYQRMLALMLNTKSLELEFQHRWSMYSLEETSAAWGLHEYVTPVTRPDQPAASRIQASSKPVTQQFLITLNAVQYEITLANESAKYNLNRGLQSLGTKEFTRLEAHLLPANSRLKLSLSQSPGNALVPRIFTPLANFKHCLKNQTESIPLVAEIIEATSNITLYGNGNIDVTVANSDVLEALCKPYLSSPETSQFITAIKADPEREPLLIMQELGLDDTKARQLANWCTNRTTCISCWIKAQSQQSAQHLILTASTQTRWNRERIRY